MQRLRPLSEAECYTRLYGRDGESGVSVIYGKVGPPRELGLSGEELRRLFEERIDAREAEWLDSGEAA